MDSYATAAQVYVAGLVFARVGAMVMLMPGIGDNAVSPRIRLSFALLMSLLISAVIVAGVHHLVAGERQPMLVFSLVYLPVLFFSLFTSFSATLGRRRAFLHSWLDAMTRADLAQANSKLLTLAHTDPLTGLSNRRLFDLTAEREVARARRQRESICVLMLDVDHFKRVNDQHGHDAADAHDGDEGRPQRHFRFAEADVAAHQAVHRFAGRHILDDVVDGFLLIRRFIEAGIRHRIGQSGVGIDTDEGIGDLRQLFGQDCVDFDFIFYFFVRVYDCCVVSVP